MTDFTVLSVWTKDARPAQGLLSALTADTSVFIGVQDGVLIQFIYFYFREPTRITGLGSSTFG